MIYLFRAGFALLLALIRRWETAEAPDPVRQGGVP
jgi:hypothetical protein